MSNARQKLEQLRAITGHLLPVLDADDRAVRALANDGTPIDITADPPPPVPVKVAVTSLPDPRTYRADVIRNEDNLITSVVITPLP
jgi:hypothetical protein